MLSREFGRFLHKFKVSLRAVGDDAFGLLANRLNTYIAYYSLEIRARILTAELMKSLRRRPRKIIKEVLALTHLAFLRDRVQLHFEGAHNSVLDGFLSPEDIASTASLMIAIANHSARLDVADFSKVLTPRIPTPQALEALNLARQEALRLEVSQLISLFGYELIEHPGKAGKTLTLRAPSREFSYVNSLGYIRTQIGSFHGMPVQGSTEAGSQAASLRALARKLVVDFPQVADVVDAGTSSQRIRLKLPIFKDLYEKISNSWFLEDAKSYERLGQEFLTPIPIQSNEEMWLTKNLSVNRFLKMWRILLFWMLIDISVLERLVPSQPDLLLNSLVRMMPDRQLETLLHEFDFARTKK